MTTRRTDAHTSLAWRSGFGGTLLLGMTVATYMTFILGVLAPFLIDEFAISRTQLGALTTILYVIGGFGSPTAGRLVDHIGGRRTLEGLFIIGAAGVVGVAFATNYAWLVVAMTVSGVSLAAGNPVTNKLVAEHLPVGTRGTIMGLKQAGVPTGTFLAGIVLPGAALVLGWRGATLLALLLPVIGLVATWVLLPPDSPATPMSPEERRAPLGPVVNWLTFYAFFMGTGVAVVNVYLPLYAFDAVGVRVTTAGFVSSFIGLTGIFARIVWGRVSERAGSVTGPLVVIALCSTTAIALILGAQWGGAWMLWVAALLFGASTLGWIVVGMIGVVEQIGLARAGRASGRVLLGFYGGFISSPVFFGAIVDATGRYELAWATIVAAFGTSTLIAAIWHRHDLAAADRRRDLALDE